MEDGEFMPIGTIPTSSGRSEGEGVVRVSPEESDLAVRKVTVSELVWAETGAPSIRVINKKPTQKRRAFLEMMQSNFKIGKQRRFRQRD